MEDFPSRELLGVCGSRHGRLTDAEEKFLRNMLYAWTCLIQGGATGIDAHAAEIGREEGCRVWTVQADWNRDGKAAGPIRNRAMAPRADVWVAFMRGAGPGTLDMIRAAKAAGKIVVTVEDGGVK